MRRRVVAFSLLALAGCVREMPPSLRHPLAGGQAPALGSIAAEPAQVGIPTGAPVKATVIDFWASWCGGCQDSIPSLDALYRDKRDEGLRVVGVSVDERADAAYAMAQALHASFPVIVDDGRLQSAYRVAQVPLTFVVDQNGTVRWVGRDPEGVRRAALLVLAE